MKLEAAILTGGKSRRMGVDKAKLLVDGEPQAVRIVRLLAERGIPVTTLGREPTPGAAFLKDPEEFAGPISALARFIPSCSLVFVASCDLPRFDVALVDALVQVFEGDAAVPVVDGYRQPLCALYHAAAFGPAEELAREGEQCAMHWLDRLRVREVSEEELRSLGVDPNVTRGANTPDELERVMRG